MIAILAVALSNPEFTMQVNCLCWFTQTLMNEECSLMNVKVNIVLLYCCSYW